MCDLLFWRFTSVTIARFCQFPFRIMLVIAFIANRVTFRAANDTYWLVGIQGSHAKIANPPFKVRFTEQSTVFHQ